MTQPTDPPRDQSSDVAFWRNLARTTEKRLIRVADRLTETAATADKLRRTSEFSDAAVLQATIVSIRRVSRLARWGVSEDLDS